MDPIHKLREGLKNAVSTALEKSKQEGLIEFETLPDFVIEVPRDEGHGDFACNAALLMARQARMSPRKIAEIITRQLEDSSPLPAVDRIEIAGAGFINFFLNQAWLYEIPALVLDKGSDYGRGARRNQKVQVEFVSANPTGNLHMGNARG